MTTTVIITLCFLLLLAYVFDITSSKTKIPSVILLLFLGWGVKQITVFVGTSIPDLNPILPIFGTIGLILIVLDGSLELEFDKSKYSLIGKSSILALSPMLLLSFGLAFAFQYYGDTTYRIGLANAIPLAIISSAIAIPSVKSLLSKHREFITYESSLSDIFGVVFFNFVVLNEEFGQRSYWMFIFEIIAIIVISFIATAGLSYLLSKMKHHVKFAPILLLVILIYGLSKIYHLPGLIFILFFGLFLGNIEKLKQYKFIDKLKPDILEHETQRFKEILGEMTFLIRSLFFLLFGYLIETSEILNLETLIWAVLIAIGILGIRAIHLKIFKLPFKPLLFIAPRGLITILLFLSIPYESSLALVNKSMIIQVIILSSFVMMYGLIKTRDVKKI